MSAVKIEMSYLRNRCLLAISCTESSCGARARRLAKKLQLPFVPLTSKEYDFLLIVTSEHIELQDTRFKMKPVWINFLDTALLYRGSQKQSGELLIRAIGSKNKKCTVLDATAGLGQDAFLMANYGYRVTMLERSPILYELLKDALRRYRQVEEDGISLRVLHRDAIRYMAKTVNKPDIVYLDPMFPHRIKSALVKKEMRFLREIVGEDLDADQLLLNALSIAKKRVIVKRPRLAPCLANKAPDFSQTGKSCRFDIYLTREKTC